MHYVLSHLIILSVNLNPLIYVSITCLHMCIINTKKTKVMIFERVVTCFLIMSSFRSSTHLNIWGFISLMGTGFEHRKGSYN